MINRDEVALSLLGYIQENPFGPDVLDLIKDALDRYGDAKRKEGHKQAEDDRAEDDYWNEDLY